MDAPRVNLARRALQAGVGVAAVLALSTGCVHVKPWERGTLADPKMQWTFAPERDGVRQHVFRVREGDAGATGGAGASCGCN